MLLNNSSLWYLLEVENNRTVDHWLFTQGQRMFQLSLQPCIPIFSLSFCFHVQCVGSSPSVILNNSAIVNAKTHDKASVLTDNLCTQTVMKEVREPITLKM